MLLSILIPSYNHESFVLKTLQAACNVGIPDKEVILIDDGSSDNSVNVIREYIASTQANENVRLIARENRGLVKTLNEGLAIAKGKYFYLVASDDIPIPEGITSLINILESNDNLQLALGNALFMDSEQQSEFKPTYGPTHRRFFSLPYEKRQKEMFLRYPQPILLQATVFRTSTLNAIGGWREDIVVDDFSLFLRIFSKLTQVGKDFGFYPNIMACFYRQHHANSHRNLERQFTMVEQALASLCPVEWKNAALFRNFALHSIAAVERRQLSMARRFFCSTLMHVGVARMIPTAVAGFTDALITRISGSRVSNTVPLIEFAPPSTIAANSRRSFS